MNNIITAIGGPTILIFIGGIITAIGAVWASLEQNKASSSIDAKNQEIIELNREIRESITGGNSFCYIRPTTNTPPIITVEHSGSHPLYDVSCRITDVDEHKTVFAKTGDRAVTQEYIDRMNVVNLGGIGVGLTGFISPVLSLEGDRKRFNIFISARNGSWTQLLRMHKRDDGVWISAIKVTRGYGDERVLLLEEIPEDYPRDSEGHVDWN